MTIVSRYTADGTYPAFAAKLKASCEKFGVKYDIQKVELVKGATRADSWQRTMYTFTEMLFHTLIGCREPICWMDSDCELIKEPTLLLNATADFAIYNWTGDPQNIHKIAYNPTTLLGSGGVIYFNYSAPAMELLARWMYMGITCLQRHNGYTGSVLKPWAQCLDLAFNNAPGLPSKNLWLPKSYNRMTALFPSIDPVINHVFVDGGHKDEKTPPAEIMIMCQKCKR